MKPGRPPSRPPPRGCTTPRCATPPIPRAPRAAAATLWPKPPQSYSTTGMRGYPRCMGRSTPTSPPRCAGTATAGSPATLLPSPRPTCPPDARPGGGPWRRGRVAPAPTGGRSAPPSPSRSPDTTGPGPPSPERGGSRQDRADLRVLADQRGPHVGEARLVTRGRPPGAVTRVEQHRRAPGQQRLEPGRAGGGGERGDQVGAPVHQVTADAHQGLGRDARALPGEHPTRDPHLREQAGAARRQPVRAQHDRHPRLQRAPGVGGLPVQPQVALRGPHQLRPRGLDLLEVLPAQRRAVDDDRRRGEPTQRDQPVELAHRARVVAPALRQMHVERGHLPAAICWITLWNRGRSREPPAGRSIAERARCAPKTFRSTLRTSDSALERTRPLAPWIAVTPPTRARTSA